jgi:GntR family transcriptional regulator
MLFQVNYKSGKAVYLQLVDQVKAAAASGALHTGSPLPGIRPLAEELRVNRNTVAKAYSELESQGVIETIAGKGCFVRANHSPFKKEVRRKLLAETLDGAVIQAHHLQCRRGALRRARAQARRRELLNAYDPQQSGDRNPQPGAPLRTHRRR